MSTRQERERAFHDQAFANQVREPAERFWVVNQALDARYQGLVSELGGGRRVLEYGCGEGSYAFVLAKGGAHVVGIDISDVAIEHARERAAREGVEENVEFRVMDAENLEFEADSFDFVCGRGILHHLDLENAFGEITRVIRPDGRAVFSEPLGHNPLINLYRRLTPRMRTVDEHPLLMGDFDIVRRHFADVELEFFTLSTLLAMPLEKRRSFPKLVGSLHRFDQRLFGAVPSSRRLAWMSLMRLASPRRS